MVRYSTGHALFGTLSSWMSDPSVTSSKTLAKSECESSLNEVENNFAFPSIVIKPQTEVVDWELDWALALRALVRWRDEVLRTRTRKIQNMKEERKQVMSQQALSVWLLRPVADSTYARAALNAWRQVVEKEQSGRAMLRTQQRVKFSQEENLQVPPSPAPVVRALGAMLISTEQPLVWGCFCAWKDASERVRCRRATLMWLMERLALSQSGLMLQASFRCWSHVSVGLKQPTWAQDLRRDVQKLLQDEGAQLDIDKSKASNLDDKSEVRACGNLQSTLILACVVLLSLLGHAILLLCHTDRTPQATIITASGNVGVDSDGDGITDGLDLCPSTPLWHKFRSTWQTDWDGDGCLDSIEDTDDDNDGVLNFQDLCPHTLISDGQVDKDGCALRQRRLLSQEAPAFEQYKGKLADASLEVFLGMILTAGVNFAWKSRGVAHKLMPTLK